MRNSTLEMLNADLENNPVLVAGGATLADVDRIEAFAGFALPSDYRAFVERYGGAIIGPYSVYGSGASAAMGDEEASAIRVTERFRRDGWPGTADELVISTDHAGNAITLDAQGNLHRFDHDSGTTELLAGSFEDFIVSWCLKAGE